MKNVIAFPFALAVLAAAGCADTRPTGLRDFRSIGDAFLTTTPGFSSVNSSFNGLGESPNGFRPDGPMGGGPGHGGPGGDFMGGGMGAEFLGGMGPAAGRFDGEHGPFAGFRLPSDCTFSSATGRVVCAAKTERGLTVSRSVAYTDASGKVQSVWDSLTTNTVNVRIDVTGTMAFGANSTVVSNSSDRTVSGLAAGSAQRTVNGTARGSEQTNGTSPMNGAFSSQRMVADTTRGLVVPIVAGKPTYPTAGTVIRTMSVTVTFAGKTPTTSTRREVVTYDGSATATMTVTENGTSKTCTLALPQGRPSCK